MWKKVFEITHKRTKEKFYILASTEGTAIARFRNKMKLSFTGKAFSEFWYIKYMGLGI